MAREVASIAWQLGRFVLLSAFLVCCFATLASTKEIRTDLLIVGGTESACAAAVQAARMGVKSVTLVNDIAWLGGQFSAEALVAIDENRGPSGYGHGVPFPRSGLFKEVIDRIEAINLARYGRARPGNTRVITTCRPADAEQAFRDMLAPYVQTGQIHVIPNYFPVAAELDRNAVKMVRFRNTHADYPDLTIEARMTIDATDWGDVIKLCGAAYEFGPDLQSKYGEPLAPTSRADFPLTDMNPITYCMVVEETDRYRPIPKPAGYDARNYRSHGYPRDPMFIYTGRRLVDHYGYAEIKSPDVLLLCYPAFDYPLDVLPKGVADSLDLTEKNASIKSIVQMSREQRQIVFDDAKRYSLGFLYYLQTEVHDGMEDKTHSFRRFRLVDEFKTSDHLPPKPYVRESLRLKAMYMMRQQDTMGHGRQANHYATDMYHDGVACWQFEFDFHPTGRRFLDNGNPAGPWTNYFRKGRTWGPPYAGKSLFPLRSMVPEKTDGLLGAQKNLGYSSIVSSAVRLHDQSMAIGQAAGAVAAVCLHHSVQARQIAYDRPLLCEVWGGLCSRLDGGVPQTLWPFHDLAPDHPAFEEINLLAARRAFPLRCDQVDFRPDQPATEKWKQDVVKRSLKTKEFQRAPVVPAGSMTRAQFVRQWWQAVKQLPDRPFVRVDMEDADGDRIPDCADPLPFDSSPSSWPPFQIPAAEDGNPDAIGEQVSMVRQFNFTGTASASVDGWQMDDGSPFSDSRGFGWIRDIRPNNRRRNRLQGSWRDSFLFTRSYDCWECMLPNGRYQVTACIGDSAFPQEGQNVTIEGRTVLRNYATDAGWFAERAIDVDVRDGRLTIEIGAKGSTTNTCLNWLRIVREK